MIRTLDFPRGAEPPGPGDLLATPRRLYRIRHVEPVETRIRCDRWRLDVERIATRSRTEDPWAPPLVVDELEEGTRYLTSEPYLDGSPSSVWGVDQ